MRQRLSTQGVGLLVVALLALALVSCDRAAPEREGEVVEPGETSAVTTAIPGGVESPVPGETVVSAVTPSTGTAVSGVEPTTAAPATTPSAPDSQATAAPAPTSGGAEPQPTAAAPVTPGEIVMHTVQPGESLSSIAQRYGTTWQAVASANGLVNPDQIFVGQQLRIPTSSSGPVPGGSTGCRIRHTVQQGEWVWQIARHYGVDPNNILAANGLTIQSANVLYPGTVLCIP